MYIIVKPPKIYVIILIRESFFFFEKLNQRKLIYIYIYIYRWVQVTPGVTSLELHIL